MLPLADTKDILLNWKLDCHRPLQAPHVSKSTGKEGGDSTGWVTGLTTKGKVSCYYTTDVRKRVSQTQENIQGAS